MQNSYSQEELQCAQALLSFNLSDSNETNERITRCCSPVVYPDDLERTIRENVANGFTYWADAYKHSLPEWDKSLTPSLIAYLDDYFKSSQVSSSVNSNKTENLRCSSSDETNERITRCCSPVVYPDDLERTIRENVANGFTYWADANNNDSSTKLSSSVNSKETENLKCSSPVVYSDDSKRTIIETVDSGFTCWDNSNETENLKCSSPVVYPDDLERTIKEKCFTKEQKKYIKKYIKKQCGKFSKKK